MIFWGCRLIIQASVDNLMIDDLCDQMKSKAVCTDGEYLMSVYSVNSLTDQAGIQSA